MNNDHRRTDTQVPRFDGATWIVKVRHLGDKGARGHEADGIAVAFHPKTRLAVTIITDELLKLGPGIHLSTVKRNDAIPRLHTSLGSRCTTVS